MKQCKRFEKQFTAYMHGELSAEQQCLLEEHLEQCAGCRAELEAQRQTLSLLNDVLAEAPAPERLSPWYAVQRRSRAYGSEYGSIWRTPQFKSVLAAGALAALFIIFSGSIVVFNIIPRSEPSPMVVTVQMDPVNGADRQDERESMPVSFHSSTELPDSLNKVAGEPPALVDQDLIPLPEFSGAGSDQLADSSSGGGSDPGFTTDGVVEYRRSDFLAAHQQNAGKDDRMLENAFMMSMESPLSTFPVEVEPAAYAAVRSFLDENRLPPVDAVRIEELVNYFAYDYPEPEGDDPLSISLEVAACPWNDGHQLAMIGLQGMKEDGGGMDESPLTIAQDVNVQVEFNPTQVKAYRLIGFDERRLVLGSFDDDSAGAAAVDAGHSVTALYELIPAGSSEKVPTSEALMYQKTQLVDSDDLMTVKLRYKKPGGSESKLLVCSVRMQDVLTTAPSESFRLACDVAEFGLLLRNSEFRGNADYSRVIQRARSTRGADRGGSLSEFIRLVEKARLLKLQEDQ